MTSATYPNGIFPWTNRVDLQSVVDANDVDSLAADLIAVEGTVGLNPQIELSTPLGTAVSYSSLSARLSDLQLGNQQPVASVNASSLSVANTAASILNVYGSALFDPLGYYNGSDITIPTGGSGWYDVTVNQTVPYGSSTPSGFLRMFLVLNSSTRLDEDYWEWNTNTTSSSWNGDDRVMSISWQGTLQPTNRLSVFTLNATNAAITMSSVYLRLQYRRAVPPTTTA